MRFIDNTFRDGGVVHPCIDRIQPVVPEPASRDLNIGAVLRCVNAESPVPLEGAVLNHDVSGSEEGNARVEIVILGISGCIRYRAVSNDQISR